MYIDAKLTTLGHRSIVNVQTRRRNDARMKKYRKYVVFFIRIVAEAEFECDDSKVGSRVEN